MKNFVKKFNSAQTKVQLLALMVSACGGQTKNLRTAPPQPVSAGESSEYRSADRSQPQVWAKGSQPLSPEEVAHKTNMHSSHGFGFNLTASQIPNALDTTKLPPDLATPEQIIAVTSGPQVSTIYSGPSLNLQQCLTVGFGGSPTQSALARAAFPAGARHLAEILPQDYLLDIFAPGENWFESALMSLEEWDPTARIRPSTPTHAFLRPRLKKANHPGPEFWKLGAVSFRVSDRSILLEQSADRAVMGQIKISYHLDTRTSESDPSIISAAFIHSIGIHANYYDEFIFDLLTIRQQPEASGCDVFRIVDKYVRNNGASIGATPRSFYFFAHTNIFDEFDPVPVHEWRFAELKPVWWDDPVAVRPVDNPLTVSIPTSRLSQFQAAMDSSMALTSFSSMPSMGSSNSFTSTTMVTSSTDVTTSSFSNAPSTSLPATQSIPQPTPTSSSSPAPGSTSTSNLYGRVTIPKQRIEIASAKYLELCLKGSWIPKWQANPAKNSLLSSDERAAIATCPTKSSQDEINACWAAAAKTRCEANVASQSFSLQTTALLNHNTPWPTSERLNGQVHPKLGRKLRIVPMKVVPLEVVNDTSDQVRPLLNRAYDVYFSGTVTDCPQLPDNDPIKIGEPDLTNPKAPKETNCRLLLNPDGSRARPDHPAFVREEAYSCAGCHNRREGLDVDPVSFKLNPMASMNKSHISPADPGNRPCSAYFTYPRSLNQVSLSPYFLDFANGHVMNGYSPVQTNPIPPASAGIFDAGNQVQRSFVSSPSIDAFRCFSNAIDPGEKLQAGGP